LKRFINADENYFIYTVYTVIIVRAGGGLWLSMLSFFYLLLLIFLMPYSYRCFILLYGSKRYRAVETPALEATHPFVTVQLPIYNERVIFPRLLRSVSELQWPRSRLEILVLDDSSEDATRLTESEARSHRSRGLDVRVVRREGREGFKAGALNNALKHTKGEYVLILDADNLPPRDLLKRTVPLFEANPRLGYVQVRLGNINRGFNRVSKAISLALDCHYIVEQPGRQSLSLVTNFDGSAAVLRKEAIMDVGGWNSETLTEDMHLSYSMRLRGWISTYLRDVVVEGEVPVTLNDFKNQQARWANGSTQTALRLVRGIWLSRAMSLPQKIDSTIHLTNYLVFPVILLSFLVMLLLTALNSFHPDSLYYWVVGASSLGGFGVFLMYAFASSQNGAGLKEKAANLGLLGALGVGLSAHFTISILKGLLRREQVFVPTPKYNLGNDNPGVKILHSNYRPPRAEYLLVLLSLSGVVLSLVKRAYALIPSFSIYLICFFVVAHYTTNP